MRLSLVLTLFFSLSALANPPATKSGGTLVNKSGPATKASIDDQMITDATASPDSLPLIRALFHAARSGAYRADQKGPLVHALRNVLQAGTQRQPRFLAALALNQMGAGEYHAEIEEGLRACFPLRHGHYRNYRDEWARIVAATRRPSEAIVRYLADIAMQGSFVDGKAAARTALENWAQSDADVRTWALSQQPRVFDPPPTTPDLTPCVVLMAVDGEPLDDLL